LYNPANGCNKRLTYLLTAYCISASINGAGELKTLSTFTIADRRYLALMTRTRFRPRA